GAAGRPEWAGFPDAHLVPGGQGRDVGGKEIARRNGNAHAQHRAREQFVGACGARTVDVGEADDEVVYAADWAFTRHRSSALVMSMRYFFMSQAPVGQRSAHSPQCSHTSSSFTMTRPVFRSLAS